MGESQHRTHNEGMRNDTEYKRRECKLRACDGGPGTGVVELKESVKEQLSEASVVEI